MTSLAQILGSMARADNSWTVTIPGTWMQGRTSYGGLSSAVAHHCATACVTDCPPLRSAQIAFAGPLAGDVTITAELLRRGRNTAFVETRTTSRDGTGLACNFIFMNPRVSTVEHNDISAPDFPPPPGKDDIRNGPPEFFTHHMDYPEKRLELGLGTPKLMQWHRLRERDGLDPITELLCVGDALPPSAMGLMTEPGNVSSMNWQVNMLTNTPQTKDGWWLLESETHHAHDGASSQYMTVYNSDRKPVMRAMQSVALFV
ncbi:thioesterase family protein [Sphingorhabdus sp. Alg239-R122]|uniref:thioesterase family protein n=1 Tax=Sphingorhabdus sp. Alg239-R122 TaxID=2305989 RepID=UPI0013D95D79|nr:thioesterase family protein [Sphingorhabdus sp. Alg239-R122]